MKKSYQIKGNFIVRLFILLIAIGWLSILIILIIGALAKKDIGLMPVILIGSLLFVFCVRLFLWLSFGSEIIELNPKNNELIVTRLKYPVKYSRTYKLENYSNAIEIGKFSLNFYKLYSTTFRLVANREKHNWIRDRIIGIDSESVEFIEPITNQIKGIN